ncbi:ROK family transcriptional regulator [Nocardioides acrostichi]|uniref:ROK family transcriptional regulator n=1 Tax=Nocardioides acrostichi TaxID=2784339 RepID=A0A930V3S2_9ACTN|nr:ROK family transcriptional regulator [Nocardioides acrostichi]MBF4163277.1 ROK family transcriptional regulator [Nocardioides acrostichi]
MSLTEPVHGQTALRAANRRRVLDLLRGSSERHPVVAPGAPSGPDDTGFTQAEMARISGLAPATVSSIVKDLAGSGLVEVSAGGGRRGSTVRLAAGAGHLVAVDFGHSHLAVAVGDAAGRPLAEARRPMPPAHPHQQALAEARTMLDELLESVAPAPLLGATLGLPAPITDDVVGSAAIFPGWEGVNAREVGEAALGVAAVVENDANLGALAEQRVGAASGSSSCVVVKISSGVGAGIVLDGHIWRGATGSAGELGHLTLDEQGPLCRCGSRGCLEAYASVTAVRALMAEQLPDADIAHIVEAARAGSVAARRAFEDAGLHLGWGLAGIATLVNPDVLVIGGDLARAGDLVLEPARTGLRRHAIDAVAGTPVLASSLGGRASLLGGLLLAAESTDLLALEG